MLSGFLLLLVIALAVAVGCYVGQKHLIEISQIKKPFSRDYFVGLNYLLNEQPDKAADVFTRLLEVDSETIEMHLTLGNLFRKKGEVGRAIRVHQNLIARPQLAKQDRVEALIALGKDYLYAGVIDRAERLFLEITALGEQPMVSLHYLREIYQSQKRWDEAILVAKQLQKLTNDLSLNAVIAHYYCELGELKQALKVDPDCTRATMLLADIERNHQRYDKAIYFYQKIRHQEAGYFAEIIKPLKACYDALNREQEFIHYLEESFKLFPDSIHIALLLANHFQKSKNDVTAIAFLADHLRQHPSLLGLHYLISLQLEKAENKKQEDLLTLQTLVQSLLQQVSPYRCTQCGFRSKSLLWLCPGCKTWGSIRPERVA